MMSRMTLRALLMLMVTAVTAVNAKDTRYEQLTAKALSQPAYTVVTASFIGGDGVDELVSGAQLSDGRLILIGNMWGPELPQWNETAVLGQGQHSGAPTFVMQRKRERLHLESPDRSGFILTLDAEGRKIITAVRCAWGVAHFVDARRAANDDVWVVGRLGPNGDSLAKSVKIAGSGGAVLVRLVDGKPTQAWRAGAATARALRVWTTPDAVWMSLYSEGEEQLWRLDAKGNHERIITRKADDTANFLGVTDDGTSYFGGDRNTHTGKEPWRQPFFYAYDDKGTKKWTWWEWASKDLRKDGHPSYGLVSDSSARQLAVDPANGHLMVGGWSDGGNSVFTRQPTDVAANAGPAASFFSGHGMKGANSLAYLMRIDPKTHQLLAWTYFLAYCPGDFAEARYRGAPNFASIERVDVGVEGDMIFCGAAATGLIQTANAFWTYGKDGTKHGGQYAAVFSNNLSRLRFSSYLPGYEATNVVPTRDGMLILGRTAADDKRPTPTAPPTVEALQDRCKGQLDGHFILMRAPELRPGR